jgi:hypothetical protein
MSDLTNDARFSADEGRILTSVLDEVIPPSPDGRFPGAGELGLASYLDQALDQTPELRPVIVQGLRAVSDAVAERGAVDFAALSPDDRRALLEAVAAEQPAFLPSLSFHTYVGYYQSTRVAEALGLEPRPPHPDGYEMEPNDLSLLEPVRQRPKLYREC